jgi:hypothetical protein
VYDWGDIGKVGVPSKAAADASLGAYATGKPLKATGIDAKMWCAAAGVDLAGLDLDVITAATLRIDTDDDRARLADTFAALRPTLLIRRRDIRRCSARACSSLASTWRRFFGSSVPPAREIAVAS